MHSPRCSHSHHHHLLVSITHRLFNTAVPNTYRARFSMYDQGVPFKTYCTMHVLNNWPQNHPILQNGHFLSQPLMQLNYVHIPECEKPLFSILTLFHGRPRHGWILSHDIDCGSFWTHFIVIMTEFFYVLSAFEVISTCFLHTSMPFHGPRLLPTSRILIRYHLSASLISWSFHRYARLNRLWCVGQVFQNHWRRALGRSILFTVKCSMLLQHFLFLAGSHLT